MPTIIEPSLTDRHHSVPWDTVLKGIICLGCRTTIKIPEDGERICPCSYKAFISVRADKQEVCWGAVDLRAIRPILEKK